MSDLLYTQYNIYFQENAVIYSTALTPVNNNQPAVNIPNLSFGVAATTTINNTGNPLASFARLNFLSEVQYNYIIQPQGNTGNVLVIPDDSGIQAFTGNLVIFSSYLNSIQAYMPGGQQLPISFTCYGATTIGLYTSSGTDLTATTAPNNPFSVTVYTW